MALEFEMITPPNDTRIYKARSGTIDGLAITAVIEPSDPYSLMFNFIEQSQFIVEMAIHMEWNVTGNTVSKIVIPFPMNVIHLFPDLEADLPPIMADNDVTTTYRCSFYYSQTEFVSGSAQLGIRSGIPLLILTPDLPVNLIKFNCNVKWQKIINLILY